MSVHVERVADLPGDLHVVVGVDEAGDSIVWMLESEISDAAATALGHTLDANRLYYRRLNLPRADVELTVDDVLNPRRAP